MMKLLIRADVTIQMGTGHVMRCLALAQAVHRRGGIVQFAMAACPVPLQKRLIQEGFRIHCILRNDLGSLLDAQDTVKLAQDLQIDWLCVDGYQFGTDYQYYLKKMGCRSLFLDDYGHASPYCAEWILNQNSSAHDRDYQTRSSQTNLLLGERYTLLRQEFWNWRGWQRKIREIPSHLLITLGGSDPDNLTSWVLTALQQFTHLKFEITVIVGGTNPHLKSLTEIASHSIHSVEVLNNVTDMPSHMVQADLAISAGGSTTWELALLGLPSLLIVAAENQAPIAQMLHESGIAISLGPSSTLDPDRFFKLLQQLCESTEQRKAMSQKGQTLIDGEGCDRVIMAMQGDRIRLRPAKWSDCEQIWQWTNDPTTRQASFQSDLILWEPHCQWFQQQLDDADSLFWIALDRHDRPVGQVRFQGSSTTMPVISMSVDPAYRQQGFGTEILTMAIDKLLRETSVLGISAWIKAENLSSIRSFEKVQFVKIRTEYKNDQLAFHYQFRKYLEDTLAHE
jgi:UDP-2,4-diacetamido-2,4,6-trideoxy-beta-L-altropyranose hydrolase